MSVFQCSAKWSTNACQCVTSLKSPADTQNFPTHPALHPQPAAYEQPHCSDTKVESPADPPPVSSAPRHTPPAAAPGPSPLLPSSAKHPPGYSSTAPGFRP